MVRGRPGAVPNVVRDSLRRDGSYDFGLGVVLRGPRDPKGRGATASYRIEYRVAPVMPGQPLAPRKEAFRRQLDAAFALATERFEEMQQRAGGTYVEYHTDVLFGTVVERWYDSPHPRWGDQYPSKVASLLRNWVTADHITVPWRAGGTPTPLVELPIGAVTADQLNQALEHVRRERAHRTYTEVHGLVVQILKWALTNRYLRPTDAHLIDHLPLARSDEGNGTVGGTRTIPPEEIPPVELVERLAVTAERLRDVRTGTQVRLLAFTGLRISECLALRNDGRFQRGDDGCWRIDVHEQIHHQQRRTLPPKWGKQRWAFVPHWLTDEVAGLLNDTTPGGLLFPSPGRKVRRNGSLTRVGVGLYPYANWRERVWTRIAEATDGWPERHDWWPPNNGPPPEGTQSERRWQWPVHALRHVCATYQLNVLGLDPDDVAKFLGHRSGVQVWEMYVKVRPDLFGRAADASRAAGDPRARP